LQLDKKCIADLVFFLHVYSTRKNHKKKIPSFFSLATPPPKKKYKEDTVAIHKQNQKIMSSYKFMGVADSSDMMLYTYLDERWTVYIRKSQLSTS
jgi:hypothetical protein